MITLVLSASVLMDDAETKVEHDADAVSAVIGKPSFKDSYKHLESMKKYDNAIRYIPYILSHYIRITKKSLPSDNFFKDWFPQAQPHLGACTRRSHGVLAQWPRPNFGPEAKCGPPRG